MKLESLSLLAIKIYSRLFFCQEIKSRLLQHVFALTLIWGNWCSLFYKYLYLRYKFTMGDILLYLGNMEKIYVVCKKAKKIKRRKKSSADNLQALLCPLGVHQLQETDDQAASHFLGPEAPGLCRILSWPPPLSGPTASFLPLSSESFCLGDRPGEPAGPGSSGAFPDSSICSVIFFLLFSTGRGENLMQMLKASAIRNITSHIIFC